MGKYKDKRRNSQSIYGIGLDADFDVFSSGVERLHLPLKECFYDVSNEVWEQKYMNDIFKNDTLTFFEESSKAWRINNVKCDLWGSLHQVLEILDGFNHWEERTKKIILDKMRNDYLFNELCNEEDVINIKNGTLTESRVELIVLSEIYQRKFQLIELSKMMLVEEDRIFGNCENTPMISLVFLMEYTLLWIVMNKIYLYYLYLIVRKLLGCANYSGNIINLLKIFKSRFLRKL
jgi:hypothetical protein